MIFLYFLIFNGNFNKVNFYGFVQKYFTTRLVYAKQTEKEHKKEDLDGPKKFCKKKNNFYTMQEKQRFFCNLIHPSMSKKRFFIRFHMDFIRKCYGLFTCFSTLIFSQQKYLHIFWFLAPFL